MDPKKRKYKNAELARFHPEWIEVSAPTKAVREKSKPPKLDAFCKFVLQIGTVEGVLAEFPVSFSDLEQYINYYGAISQPQLIGLIISILEGTYDIER